MRNLTLIILISFSLNITAQNDLENDLENDSLVHKIFDQVEIKELHKLIDYFDSVVVSNYRSSKKIEFCYRKYFKKILKKVESKGEIDFKLCFEEFYNIVDNLDSSVFNDIWKYYKYKDRKTLEIYQTLDLRLNSKFIEFLKEMAKVDSNYLTYYEGLFASGGISPIHIAGVLHNYKSFKYGRERDRLFLAIHYTSFLYKKKIE